MFSVIDIIKALTILIETNFPNYPVNDKDIQEGFDRPSYFIDVDNMVVDNVTAQYYRETVNYSLFFFAENIYKGFLDLLKVKNDLVKLLADPIVVTKDVEGKKNTVHIILDELTFNIDNNDKVLTCTFSSVLIQGREDKDTHPVIDTLVYEGMTVQTNTEEE